MADRMPRIFRTLETRNGQSAFDNIAKAAVADFLELRRPAATHVADFGRLLSSIWSKLSREAKQEVAISLATSPHVPRLVVELLIAEPAEISAPFLFASPCLTSHDAASLASTEAPAPLRDAAGHERPDYVIRVQVQQSSTMAPEEDDDPQIIMKSAAAARDALRALARVQQRRPPLNIDPAVINARPQPASANPSNPLEFSTAALLQEARRGSPARAVQLIAAALGLAPDVAETLGAGSDGRGLAAALKLLGLSTSDSMTVVLLIHETGGRDVDAFKALRRFTEDVSIEACHVALGLEYRPVASALEDTSRPQHRPLHDEGAGYRASTRSRQTSFGRRAITPQIARGSNSS